MTFKEIVEKVLVEAHQDDVHNTTDILINKIISFIISEVNYDGLENSDSVVQRILKTISKP